MGIRLGQTSWFPLWEGVGGAVSLRTADVCVK